LFVYENSTRCCAGLTGDGDVPTTSAAPGGAG
jgi:hypothetical protein